MILIIGIPNAGKTTYSKKYDSVIHLDDIRHENSVKQCCQLAKEANDDVVVEGVFNSIRRRKMLLDACKDKSEKVCIWISTDVDECIKRENRGRGRGLVLIHHKRFEPPTYNEGWDKIIIISDDGSATELKEKNNE